MEELYLRGALPLAMICIALVFIGAPALLLSDLKNDKLTKIAVGCMSGFWLPLAILLLWCIQARRSVTVDESSAVRFIIFMIGCGLLGGVAGWFLWFLSKRA